MISCNGFFGFTKCLQKAQSFKTSELKFNLDEQKATESTGSSRLYLFSNDCKNKRTEKSYNDDLKQVNKNIAAKLKDSSISTSFLRYNVSSTL
jgi:hypothetical protein